jgi:hypothetical protein
MLPFDVLNPPHRADVLRGNGQGGAVDPAVLDRATGTAIHRRLHSPVCVFLIVYGVAKLAELADWSRLHGDVVAMLDRGSGTVTGLLVAGKGAELVLTGLAVLALTRRNATLLLAAITGWTADLLLLAAVAAIYADLGRLLEHGLTFVAFAGLLAVTYAFGDVRAKDVIQTVRRRRRLPPESHETRQDPHEPDATRQDLPVRRPDVTRQDLPVRGPDVTRQDLPVRRPDVTRQDLPVRRPHTPEP